jgi:putative transcriptional regulator
MIVAEIDLALARFNSRLQQGGKPRLTAQELAARIGITPENLSKLRNGHFSAVKRSTLDALCRELECQPGDLLRWAPGAPDDGGGE